MGVVKREGKWKLEKKKEGVYLVTERGDQVAKIITGDYEPSGLSDERSSMMNTVIEVKNFKEAKKEFNKYAKGDKSSGLW